MSDALDYLPQLLHGALLTVLITLVVMILAVALALAVAVARTTGPVWLRAPLVGYVEIIRGTPILVQLYYIFYVLPVLGVSLSAVIAGVVGLTVAYAAYLSEVYRAAILSIPHVQHEASESLGFSKFKSYRLIIVPQAARVALPPTVNYLLSLFKDTSLLSIITIQELMFRGLLIGSTTFKYFTIFTEVAVIYFIMCYPWAWLASRLERRLNADGFALDARRRRFALSRFAGPAATVGPGGGEGGMP